MLFYDVTNLEAQDYQLKRLPKIISKVQKAIKRPYHPILISILLILLSFLIFWIFVINFIPTWTDRGLFGDTFGALNTFFSGIALFGIIYALFLQQHQLKTMQYSIELQQQPVVSIDVNQFKIDRPSVFRSPESLAEALSRFHCNISLSNVSEIPAINLVVSASLFIPTDKGQKIIRSIGDHFPLVTSLAPVSAEPMLVPDEETTALFQSLRNKNAFALPTVEIELVYRNLIGTCFAVKQGYYVVPSVSVESDLRSWHATINSFTAIYQEELAALANAKGEKSDELFDKLKERFFAVSGEKEYVHLDLVKIPGAFDARAVKKEYYDNFLQFIGLPQFVFPETKCPFDDI